MSQARVLDPKARIERWECPSCGIPEASGFHNAVVDDMYQRCPGGTLVKRGYVSDEVFLQVNADAGRWFDETLRLRRVLREIAEPIYEVYQDSSNWKDLGQVIKTIAAALEPGEGSTESTGEGEPA